MRWGTVMGCNGVDRVGCHATEWDAVGWDRGDGKSCDAMGCNVWDELQCNDVRCGGMGWMGWGLMRCPVRHRSTRTPSAPSPPYGQGWGRRPSSLFPPPLSGLCAVRGAATARRGRRCHAAPRRAEPHRRPTRGGPGCALAVPSRGAGTRGGWKALLPFPPPGCDGFGRTSHRISLGAWGSAELWTDRS